MTFFLLVAESIGHIGEMHPDRYLFLAKVGYFFIFLLDPVDILFALSYIDCWMTEGSNPHRKIFHVAFRVFAVLNMAAVVIDQLFGLHLLYNFSGHEYVRGDFFMIRGTLLLIFIVLLVAYVIIFRKDIPERYRDSLTMLPTVSLFGAMVQIFFTNLNTTYAGISVGCLVLFFFLQSRDINIDYLTGLLNRRGIDLKLEEAIRSSQITGKPFPAIMMDVDHFKQINDCKGHNAGDEMLQETAQILVHVFGSGASIGRFGGDEFCVIPGELTTQNEVLDKIVKARAELSELRQADRWPEDVDLSCGFMFYDPADHLTMKEFQEMIDIRMYEEKQKHHLEDRRKSKQ